MGMCQLQQFLNRCLLLVTRWISHSHDNRHPLTCPDPLSPSVLAYPAWIGPLNRGKGTLPRLNATVLDWQCIRLTCLLYLFVLAGSMHVNLFSSLHVMNLLVDYITFLTPCISQLLHFTLYLTWPLTICLHLYLYSIPYILYYEGNRRSVGCQNI